MPDARSRFLELDEYRVEREWRRYEGTPQRELFRELRVRFLDRHGSAGRWALEVGPGPGRFTPHVGGPGGRRVLLDLSEGMLRAARRRLGVGETATLATDAVRGDALRPPFRAGQFGTVALLGNIVGFAGPGGDQLLEACARLVAPGGEILVESVAGTGERSRYLRRLPPGAVRRLLLAPVNAVRPRIEREGFQPEGGADPRGTFRRLGASELESRLGALGFDVTESMAVAPLLGADADRIQAVHSEPRAWQHLLELEELAGRSDVRRSRAAALLVAGRRRA